jgi:hypothetical protein
MWLLRLSATARRSTRSWAAPSSENIAEVMSMFGAMYDLAAQHEMSVDDDAGYTARLALRAASTREQRYPTQDEARRVVEEAWGLTPTRRR